jgi:hypothetical protein
VVEIITAEGSIAKVASNYDFPMTLLQTLNKDVRSSVERLLYVLNPIRAIGLRTQDPREDQRFLTVSRDIWVASARSIVQQIRTREARKGKMGEEARIGFAVTQAEASGLKDPFVTRGVAEMVIKLYHLGDDLPDSEL